MICKFINKLLGDLDLKHVKAVEAEEHEKDVKVVETDKVVKPDKVVETDKDIMLKPVQFKNDSERLAKEYVKLIKVNKPLYEIIEALNEHANDKFGKNLLITMIYRTQAEQDYLYRNSERYKRRKFRSPHQFWHAVDLRSRGFKDDEIAELVRFANDHHGEGNYYKFVADYHEIGNNGFHFHVQYIKA